MKLSFFVTIASVLARNKPQLDDTAGFTGFFMRKWQKMVKTEKLSDWDTDRTEKFTTNLEKLRNKIITGTTNCQKLKQKLLENEINEDDASAELKRRKRELEVAHEDINQKRSGWSDYQRKYMTSYHQELKAKDLARSMARRGGKHSTPQHRLTHILDKFKQMILFGIEECAKVHLHDNLGRRLHKLSNRRNHLHQQGARFLAKSQGHEWNKDKK